MAGDGPGRSATSTAPRTAAADDRAALEVEQHDRDHRARARPALTPMTSGLASGLRSVVWKMAPPTPNASPTSTASTARGSLVSIRMNDAPGNVPAEEDPEEVGDRVGEVAEQHPRGEGRQQRQRQAGDKIGRRRREPGGPGAPRRRVRSAPGSSTASAAITGRPSGRGAQDQEHRHPDDGGHDADLHLGRRQHDPADGVGEHDEERADDGTERQHRA